MKLFIILSIVFFSFSQLSFGAEGYQPLAPIPGLTDVETAGEESVDLSSYIGMLYTWGVALTSGLAVIVIMWGGIGYMTSAGGGGIEEAKGRINAAILGLLLALGSYIILKTINADLLDTTFELGELNVEGTTATQSTSAPK